MLVLGLVLGLALGSVLVPTLLVALSAAPSAAHGPQDSRALFEEVQRLLHRGAFTEIVALLEHAEREHPYDEVIARAKHWRAFALWRLGDESSLRRAADELEVLVRDHPDVAVRLDTQALCERLARALVEHDAGFVAEEVEALTERLRAHAAATSLTPSDSTAGVGPGSEGRR